jgi:alpha-glucosidase
MDALDRARFAGDVDGSLRFDLDAGWQCCVHVLAADIVRVLFLRNGTLSEPRTWMIAPNGVDVPWEGRDRLDTGGFARPGFTLEPRENAVALAAGALSVVVTLRPFALRWSVDGTAFAADRPTSAYEWSERRAVVRHSMARVSTDRYFGLGDKTGPLDKRGRRLRTVALDALGYDAETSDPLYKHWPFLIGRDEASGIAYGMLYDTLAPVTFDLGCEHDNYHGFYRYAEIDDGDLDYYVFVGPRVRDVVRKFTKLTGRMAFGPRWSLGYANTAMSLTDAPDAQARLADFAERTARHAIPLSAFHFGSGYTSIGRRRYVFTWNRDKFPQSRAAVERFKAQGTRVVVNLKPCLLDDHPAYADVAARGAFVKRATTGAPCLAQFWDGEGAHVDFTHPEGVRWWQDGLRRAVLDYGIDAGWNDNNEYGIWQDDGVSHGFGQSIPIHRSRPLHALLMTRATAEAQAAHRPGERVYTVTRAGPPGIQRYAQTWSGDNTTSWHTLRWNIRMGLTMSLSGMFNTGHDIGGFAGAVPDAELLVRWVQAGAFNPRFIMNSWKAGGETNSPWLHPDVLAIVRDWIRLRYRLMPYVYTLYWRAMQFGEPMLRPLFYDFEQDPRAFDDCDDFLLGPNLLVAPIVAAGQRARSVYLPRGPAGWVDLWTGAHYRSGMTVDAAAPLERIPLYAPAGAVIPTTDTGDMRRLHDEPSRALRLFPGRGSGASAFTLYEDDGATLAYQDGTSATVGIDLEWTSRRIRLRASVAGAYALPCRTMRVRLPPGESRRLEAVAEGIELIAAG